MKASANRKLRDKLAADNPVWGLWVTLESPSVTEIAVACGLDWVVIDAEHGHLDWKEIVEHLRASARSDTVALVRLAELNAGLVKRALDLGADGIVVPGVATVEDLKRAMAYAHYPPEGIRGIGAERATLWGQQIAEHVAESRQNMFVVPIIESVDGGRNISRLLDVPGAEIFFFGPADYSASAGSAGQWEGPGVAEAILAAKDQIRARGKHCGVMAISNKDLSERVEQGFRMLGLGADCGLLIRSVKEALATSGSSPETRATLRATQDAPAGTAANPLPHPPDSMRPDRPEVMTAWGTGARIVLAPGVVFESLVGAHNAAQKLTTGIVTLAPGAVLPYHRHTFGESVTLLQGRTMTEVEGRMYSLEPMDNITIPRGLAHSTANHGSGEPALLHVSLATAEPTREMVDTFFPRRSMSNENHAVSGNERVTRFRLAERYSAGPNTSFIDFFNSKLMPEIEMSGGFGRFGTEGRLPAHVHDFDESICIIEGTATCIVEGRAYELNNNGTALQPRGRVHYFINKTESPMEMIWVYAGPLPERIVVDESCATVEGNPWK